MEANRLVEARPLGLVLLGGAIGTAGRERLHLLLPAEGGIPYDDPTVNVQWPDCGCAHKTSAKDKEHTPFAEQKFEYFEKY